MTNFFAIRLPVGPTPRGVSVGAPARIRTWDLRLRRNLTISQAALNSACFRHLLNRAGINYAAWGQNLCQSFAMGAQPTDGTAHTSKSEPTHRKCVGSRTGTEAVDGDPQFQG